MPMSQEQLADELAQIGIPLEQYRVVVALPLVHVAWADGTVQEPEAALISRIARNLGLLEAGAEELLASWLKQEPSPYFFHRGRKILAELYLQDEGMGADIDGQLLSDVLACCEGVADSAGGVFGLFGRMAREEQAAIQKIAGALPVQKAKTWAEVRSRFVE